MKSLIVIIFLVLSSSAYTQNKQHDATSHQQDKNLSPEEKGAKEADKAEKKLLLSADQKLKWQNAATARAQSNAPIRTKMEGSTTPDERKTLRDDMHKNNQKFETDIAQFLTPDQMTKYKEAKKEKKGKAHAHHKKQSEVPPVSPE